MLISELAKEIHENAVQHGWWDTKRDPMETIALIHSEWSEALEEARAGRPMVYRMCLEDPEEEAVCNPKDQGDCLRLMSGRETECKYYGKKPEGIAVEIIDGCIRILDYFGSVKCEVTEKDGSPSTVEGLYENNAEKLPDYDVPKMICDLHLATSLSVEHGTLGDPNILYLCHALIIGMSWVKKQGLDPMALLMEKHEYNKTRPYKHGKKF